MDDQLFFEFKHPAKRREQMLLDVDFGRRRNKVLLAAILREISKWPPGECYPSQKTLAAMFKCGPKTIQRALDALAELDLVVAQLKGRTFPDGTSRTLNHYFINWTALEQRVESQRPLRQPGVLSAHERPTLPIRQPGVLSPDATFFASDATVAPDRCDSCAPPIGQLDATDTTPSCRTNGLIENKQQQQDEMVVVVSSLGVRKAQEAISAARARGWEDSAIQAIVDDWKAQPAETRDPGHLFNWLATENSYHPNERKPKQPAIANPAQQRMVGSIWRCLRDAPISELQRAYDALGEQFQAGLSHQHEEKLGKLLRHAETKGWNAEQIMHALANLRAEFDQPAVSLHVVGA